MNIDQLLSTLKMSNFIFDQFTDSPRLCVGTFQQTMKYSLNLQSHSQALTTRRFVLLSIAHPPPSIWWCSAVE
jgi:hypothetical protein